MKKNGIAIVALGCLFGLGGCDPAGEVAVLQDQLCNIAQAVGDEFDGFNIPDFCD